MGRRWAHLNSFGEDCTLFLDEEKDIGIGLSRIFSVRETRGSLEAQNDHVPI